MRTKIAEGRLRGINKDIITTWYNDGSVESLEVPGTLSYTGTITGGIFSYQTSLVDSED